MECMFDRRESHAGRGVPASPRQVGKDARRRSHEGEKCKEIKKTKLGKKEEECERSARETMVHHYPRSMVLWWRIKLSTTGEIFLLAFPSAWALDLV